MLVDSIAKESPAQRCDVKSGDVITAVGKRSVSRPIDLERALLALPPELRQVLCAMVLDGLTTRETSVLLGMPEGTVKTRARRARIALREALS